MSDYCPNCESSAKRIAELEAENEKLKWKQEYAAGVTGCFFGLAEALAAELAAELAALKGRRCEACRFDHCEIYRAARWPREREDFGCAAWTERGTE